MSDAGMSDAPSWQGVADLVRQHNERQAPDRCSRCGTHHGVVVPCRMDVVGQAPDPVDHPPHYNAHPSGVECIDVVEHMGFNLGNAIKYIWRADEKGNVLEDLRKAAWYVAREIQRREATT